MDFYGLADQTLIEISKVSPLTWFRICEMVPFIGEWTPCPSTQRLVKKPFIHAVKDYCKTTHHYLNTSRHRDGDLPAYEGDCGDKRWYISGNMHRDNDLPAYEKADGGKSWWISGKLHRDNDLPAIEYANGDKEWYILGKLHRDNDLPAYEGANGHKFWYKNGVYIPPRLNQTS
jgi:hypothetical protein